MSKSAFASLGVGERVGGLPLRLCVGGNDELGYAVAIVDRIGLLGEVGDDDADVATIVGIDSAWRVEASDAVFERHPRPWAHLCFIACGKGDVDACGNKAALEGLKGDGRSDKGAQVHSCTLCCGILWQWVMGVIDDGYFYHFCFFFSDCDGESHVSFSQM